MEWVTCLRCPDKYKWRPRTAGLPRKCPKCGSYLWNVPKEKPKGKEKAK